MALYDVLAAANTAAASQVSTHETDTTSVHGIADTSLLETTSGAQDKADAAEAAAVATSAAAIAAHEADTLGVHGIADTSELETASGAQDKADAAAAAASVALAGHAADTTSVHGIADTTDLLTEATLAALVADGEYLLRSGSNIVGGTPSGGSGEATSSLATVADLATTAGALGDVVHVRGVRGGIFDFAASGTADDVFVFDALTSGVWKRRWDGMEVPVTWAGAVPSTTYAGMSDQSTAINAAINALSDQLSGGTITFPVDPDAGVGWYGCASPINVFYNAGVQAQKRGCIVLKGTGGIGYGQNNIPPSRLVYTGTGDRFIDARSSTTRIENLGIFYNNTTHRFVSDGRIVAGSNLLTSATANFVAGDVGKRISCEGIPARCEILEVNSTTEVAFGVPLSLGTDSLANVGTAATSTNVTLPGTALAADVGKLISGDGIPANTYIAARVDANNLTLSKAATATATITASVSKHVSTAFRTRGRTLTDVVLNGTTTMTSATGAFTEADFGARIIGSGIATDASGTPGTYIKTITSTTSVVISVAATAGDPVTVKVGEVPVVIGGFQGALLDYCNYPNSVSAGASSGDSNGGVVRECLLGTYTESGARPCTADALINIGNVVFFAAKDCKLLGTRYGIRGVGWPQDGGLNRTYFANGVHIENVECAYNWGSILFNPAQSWKCIAIGVEGSRGEAAYDTPGDSGTDRLLLSDEHGGDASAISIDGAWFGDTGGSLYPEVWISNGPATWYGVNLSNIHFGDTAADVAIRLEGIVGGLTITGCNFSTPSALQIVNNSNRKEGINFFGNNLRNATTPVAFTGTGSGVGKYGVYVWGNYDNAQGTNPASEWWGGIGDLRAPASQPAGVPLVGFKNSSGTRRMAFDSSARLQFVDATLTTTTVGAAGGASALPATPTGYFTVLNSAGTAVKIPFYTS